jgi:hypothetical protein
VLACAPLALAGKPQAAETPWVEHEHPSGAFVFRTPQSWTVEPVAGRKDLLQASGGEGLVWFMFRPGEAGFDSLHVSCMGERLLPPIEVFPQVRYEYDFRTGPFAGRASVDSAFYVIYDRPVLGELEWRQRNLTVVGMGQSLCLTVHTPRRVWKKSKTARQTLDRVVASVTFRPQQ